MSGDRAEEQMDLHIGVLALADLVCVCVVSMYMYVISKLVARLVCVRASRTCQGDH